MDHNNLPPAARTNYLARFVFDNEIIGTRPHMIRLRPIRQAGTNYDDQRILAQFANVMNREVRRLLRIHLPTWTPAQFNQNVRGRLIMANWNNEGNANVEDINLPDLTAATFNRMFDEATANGSNPDLSIYDVTWTYFIIPTSLVLGASFGKFRNTANLKGIAHWAKKLVPTNLIRAEDIGCATIALAVGMDRVIPKQEFKANHSKMWCGSKPFTEHCHQLQLDLELGTICTVHDLKVFTVLFPDWRVAVIYSAFTVPTIYEGENYSRDSNHKKDKTVFIFYDLKSNHFIPVSGLVALLQSLSNTNHKVCLECCTTYNKNVGKSSCLCKEKKGITRAHKKVICGCGAEYQKGEDHRCGESQCHFCEQFYKENKDNTLSKFHRCPIYINPSSIEKIFKGISKLIRR